MGNWERVDAAIYRPNRWKFKKGTNMDLGPKYILCQGSTLWKVISGPFMKADQLAGNSILVVSGPFLEADPFVHHVHFEAENLRLLTHHPLRPPASAAACGETSAKRSLTGGSSQTRTPQRNQMETTENRVCLLGRTQHALCYSPFSGTRLPLLPKVETSWKNGPGRFSYEILIHSMFKD